MHIIDKTISQIIQWVGKEKWADFVFWQARLGNIDLMKLSWKQLGIHKYENLEVTGEKKFITIFLPKILKSSSSTLFDVGANIGEFSSLLYDVFPEGNILAFEPVSSTYTQLKKTTGIKNIQIHPFGLGSQSGDFEIFLTGNEEDHAFASIYQEVTNTIHNAEPKSEIIRLKTLDEVCDEMEISSIDFLKIDTEGHEFSVLKGASKLLAENRIGIILFEFNEMNVVSRVFLRDFYHLLPEYNFFRLDSTHLIPLGPYHSKNEIFQFQNIVAIPARVDVNISDLYWG